MTDVLVVSELIDGGPSVTTPPTGAVPAVIKKHQTRCTPEGSTLLMEFLGTGSEAMHEDDGKPGVGMVFNVGMEFNSVVDRDGTAGPCNGALPEMSRV